MLKETEVRNSIELAKASLTAAAEQVLWQIENGAWKTLGYADWDEMRQAEYGGAAFMVPRADRAELVTRMRSVGLTQQEIASTAGVGRRTVGNLLSGKNATEDQPATITNARGQERPASQKKKPSTKAPNLDLVNDIKLYLRTMSQAKSIGDLPPKAHDFLIEALQEAIDHINHIKQQEPPAEKRGTATRHRCPGSSNQHTPRGPHDDE